MIENIKNEIVSRGYQCVLGDNKGVGRLSVNIQLSDGTVTSFGLDRYTFSHEDDAQTIANYLIRESRLRVVLNKELTQYIIYLDGFYHTDDDGLRVNVGVLPGILLDDL